MARSLLIFVQVSLREVRPCLVRRQKQPACPFRGRRRRDLRGPTNRLETTVSRHWWTATRPSTPSAIAPRICPGRNAAPTTHRTLRTADDRATARPPTRRREPNLTIATPPRTNVPTTMPTPTPVPTSMRAPTRTPTRSSAQGRNPAPRKQTTRSQPQSHLPAIVRQPIPRPARRNTAARQRRRRTQLRL